MMPPPLARWLLRTVLPDAHRGVVMTHLDEEFARVQRERSVGAAAWWYRRQAFGSLPGALRMRARSLRVSHVLREFPQDARYALRQMRRAPGFSAAAVLMLAVGLGLVAGAYTVVNGIFVRGWAVPDSASVFRAVGSVAGAPEGGRIRDGFSLGAFKHVRENARSADYIAILIQYFSLEPGRGAPAVHSAGLFVTDNFLDVLRIPLQVGPGFIGTAAGEGVRVIISHRTWKRSFNADVRVVGRAVWLTGVPATVVGVTAAGFDSLAERPVDLIVEMSGATQWQRNGGEAVANETSCCIILAGRRRAHWTMAQVREELTLLTGQYRRSAALPELTVAVRGTAPGVPPGRGASLIFTLLGAGATLVWCLTCANVGNLFLARSLRRDREIAVRLALGASRGRLVRQLLAEGLVLAAVAGSAAYACTAGVPILMEQIDGTAAMFAPDWIVAAFAALGTIVTCLLVALAPALQATRIAWKGAGTTTTMRAGRLREVVLAVQIAVAAVLVLSATLIGRGIGQATDARADFALKTTTAAVFRLPPNAAADQGRREAVRASLRDAASKSERRLALVDQSPATDRAASQTSVRPIESRAEFSMKLLPLSATAFEILEVPMVEGRLHDDNPATGEALVNQTLARRLWPGESAVGKTLVLNYNDRTYTIVGVSRDAHLTALGAIEPMMHIPPTGAPRDGSVGHLLARSAPELADRMSALAKGIDPALTVRLTPLSESVQSTLSDARIGAAVAAGLGGVALLLAVIGVFGVFSYLIEERRREIGIRLALGATKRQIRLAVAHACRRPAVAGVLGGLALSLLAGRLLQRFLFGLSPVDPLSYAIVAGVLLAAATAATAVPVRRALRVDPAITLRAD
jgi:putative ABC transport system permease protein